MTDTQYNSGWDAVEPLMDAWLEIRGIPIHWYEREKTYSALDALHKVYIAERDAMLIPIGVTFDELCAENERRLDARG